MDTSDKKYLISVAPLTRIALSRDQSFFYTWHEMLSTGTLVTISIGRRTVEGIVTDSAPDFPRESQFQIKRVTKIIEKDFLTKEQLQLAQYISEYYYAPLGLVFKHFIPRRTMMRGTPVTLRIKKHTIKTNVTQEDVIAQLFTAHKTSKSFFLHAPVVHDKMTILLGLLQKIHAETTSQTLYILPELMQTPYISEFFHQFFPADEIAILHSKIPRGQYYHKWRAIRTGKARIIIGTRSALFAPFTKLATVIIDEAHDPSHKQWDHYPLYDARTVSYTLAKLHNATHILTSAAPRAVDYVHKLTKDTSLTFIQSPENAKAKIEIVDMKKERWDKNRSPLSRTLTYQIRTALQKNKQVLLFVNRQGESAFSLCTKCRTVVLCPTCDRALIHHSSKKYFCIHCHFTMPSSAKCTVCKAPIEHIGIGTQRISKELHKALPKARIAVVDSSTMQKTGAHKKIYDNFRDKKIDIVIGTQMITKGWHGDNVALVGIIDMDDLLSLPSYDGNEKAFSHIMQLTARTHHGTVLVQTFQPENPALRYACTYDFDGFYRDELDLRKALSYPPYTQLIKLTCKGDAKEKVQTLVKEKYNTLCDVCKSDPKIRISEPHDPLVNKVRTKYYRQIVVRCAHKKIPQALHYVLRDCDLTWSIDVDPISIV
jgi:primosomal protein N' (replication factor Y)